MKIGIDIDDTITDSWECSIPYYSRLFNIPVDILHKGKPYYESVKHLISIDEYFKIMLPVYDEVTPNVHLEPHVKETIDELYNMGCTVYFITSRGIDHTDAYKDSKDYLDKYNIKYEKIFVGCHNKAEVCQELGIDLFIDDSYHHCKEVSDIGIKVLMPTRYYNKEYQEFTHFADWQEVSEYVKQVMDNG